VSTCAIMMVKDEADIIGTTVEHLKGHVDAIIVADNGSTDGTREILDGYDDGHALYVLEDNEIGYFQSAKMTALADRARRDGHEWVLPCDADEIWHSCEVPRPIRETLASVAANVGTVSASLYDHVTTGPISTPTDDPVRRMVWRRREAAPLPKVCARLLPGIVLEQGNHGAHFPGRMALSRHTCLAVRHFPYRSLQQFVSKVRNGAAAYAATDLPWSMGQHWREYGGHLERGGPAAISEIYETWFHVMLPENDETLIMDPAPVRVMA
jgi:glycosyltransferase involved in cell wall biosynthesis